MTAFRRLALLTTGATYFLVFVGGLVRVSGAGLGCPDWPKCFGRWIPPTSLDQLPPDIDPSTFNITLAWIEYINRLVGVTVGFLILAVAVLAIRHFRKTPRVLYSSLAAAILVAIQGWQGSQVVASELEPLIVTIHMVLALVIVSLLIFATLESYTVSAERDKRTAEFPRYIRTLIGVLWPVTIIQIILGSQVRQALETVASQYPRMSNAQWFAHVGAINELHLIVGILVGLLTVYTGLVVLRSDAGKAATVRYVVFGMMALVVLQAGSGLKLLVSGVPALTDLFHLWFASLYIGLLLVLWSVVRGPVRLAFEWGTGFRKLAATTLVFVILMGVGAWLVIDQAMQSREQTALANNTSGTTRTVDVIPSEHP
ncbi:MAG: COX15/CtaA family protein [Candidatus Zixiibacteriota bacterium]